MDFGGGTGRGVRRDSKAGLFKLAEGFAEVDLADLSGVFEDAQGATYSQVKGFCDATTSRFIDQDCFGIELYCELKRVTLAKVQPDQGRIHNCGSGTNFNPFRSASDPLAHSFWRTWMLKLLNDTLRKKYLSIQGRNQLDLFNQDKVAKGRCIGDDDHPCCLSPAISFSKSSTP